MDALATPDTANDDSGHVVPYVLRSNIHASAAKVRPIRHESNLSCMVTRPDAAEHIHRSAAASAGSHDHLTTRRTRTRVGATDHTCRAVQWWSIQREAIGSCVIPCSLPIDSHHWTMRAAFEQPKTCCPSHDGKEKASTPWSHDLTWSAQELRMMEGVPKCPLRQLASCSCARVAARPTSSNR